MLGRDAVVGRLRMRNTIAGLFSVFNSAISLRNAHLQNVTVPQSLLYLFQSSASIVQSVFEGLALGGTGSLVTSLSQSTL